MVLLSTACRLWLCRMAGAIAMLVGIGSAIAAEPPAWWNDPIKDDAVNCYFPASGVSVVSSDEALQQAQSNALELIAFRLGGGQASTALHRYLLANIRNWNLHATEEKLKGRSHHVWIIVKYPQEEMQSLRARIALGAKLNDLWGEAKTALSKRDCGAAIAILRVILADYQKAINVCFSGEELKVCLGDACRDSKDFLNARIYYEDVLRGSGVGRWQSKAREGINSLPEHPRFWELSNRWGHGGVALLCLTRKGDGVNGFDALTTVLTKDCRDCTVRCVDMSRVLVSRDALTVFDRSNPFPHAEVAINSGAGVLLAVLIDVDSLKIDAKNKKLIGADATDAMAYYTAVRLSDGSSLVSGSFPLITWNRPDTTIAQFVSAILIRNLVDDCPAL